MKLGYYFSKFISIFKEGVNYTRNASFPAGHYYSPILNIREYRKNDAGKKDRSTHNPDIDLNEAFQEQLLSDFSVYAGDMPDWKTPAAGLRYHTNNTWYTQTDGFMLYAMLRRFAPRQIIEVGSGFSSALMLDVNRLFFERRMKLCFVEPHTERLRSLLQKEDYAAVEIIEQPVQQVSLDRFRALQANDILLVDSSHITKTASDVNFLFFEVFPVLASGVIIHIHDIFYPFEYPEDWIISGRNWNEIYLLQAFLQNNKAYEVLLFTDYLQCKKPALMDTIPALKEIKNGSSIYLRKR